MHLRDCWWHWPSFHLFIGHFAFLFSGLAVRILCTSLYWVIYFLLMCRSSLWSMDSNLLSDLSVPSNLLLQFIAYLLYFESFMCKEFKKFHVARLRNHSLILCAFYSLFKKYLRITQICSIDMQGFFSPLGKLKDCWYFTLGFSFT